MHAIKGQPSAGGSRRKLFGILAIGVFCLLAGLAARHRLHKIADQPKDWSPPPRKGLNAPFIVTPDVVAEKMVELAELNEGDLVYDLGCGDGRIVITAALKSGCKGIGFDIDPKRVAEARENARSHGVEDRVRFVEQDIFTVDLSKADVAMMYLLPWMMDQLLPQFQQMKPGCRIVSHDYWIHGVEPEEVIELPAVGDYHDSDIYLYVTPLKMNPDMEKGTPPRPGHRSSPQADGPQSPA